MPKYFIMPELAPNYKHLENSLKVLFDLNQDHVVTINASGTAIDGTRALMSRKEERFSLTIEDPTHQYSSLNDINDIGWEFGRHKMKADRIFPVSTDFNSVTALVSNFTTGDFNEQKEGHFRLIIPFPGDLHFNLYFPLSIYSTRYEGLNRNVRGCVKIQLNKREMDLYIFSPEANGKAYLVIDSNTQMVFEEFNKITFAILVSAGYITGYLVQGNGFFFSYKDNLMDMPTGMHYMELRSSIKSLYSPIIANVYSIVQDHDIAEMEKDDLLKLDNDKFSTLCQQAYLSQRFVAILLLVIEATVATQVLMPAAFTVALEGMTDIIMNENPEKFTPIPDKKLAKDFRGDLLNVLAKYEDRLSEYGTETLKKKINGINTATNADQLYKPFEVVGFHLEDVDKEAIDHRNDFMHGRITLLRLDEKGEETSPFVEPFRHLHYTALRIYTLLAVLILRRIGFNGKIINHPKVQEQVRGIPVNEPYFRTIHNIPCGWNNKKSESKFKFMPAGREACN